jgi:rod shape determining protein RodA
MRKAKNIFANIDTASVFLYILLISFGWLNIYASQYNDDTNFVIDFSSRYGKQLFFICFSLLIAFLILIIDWKFFYSLSYIFYGIIVTSLILLLIIGGVTSGATSWFEIGNFKFQPSEFAKFATALALAKYFNMQHIKNKKFQTKFISYLIIIIIPFLLIILQNDTGTALVYSSFILVLYREGLSANILIFFLIIGILFILTLLIDKIILSIIFTVLTLAIVFFLRKNKKDIIMILLGWILSLFFIFSVNYIFNNVLPPHQSKRINVLLGKDFDPYGAGYNLIQSKIAIGSGGFSGKGFLNGTQTRFDFVPEQSTDFIFCTIGEEWGFIGSFLFIMTFMGLVIRLIFLSERQRSNFSRIYGYSVACILFAHFVINLGMTIGLIPVIGIPLPFVSYGGSSLLGFTILLFIFLNLDSYRLQILR